MRVLVRIVTSTVYDVFPLFMVKADGLNDEETDALIQRILVEYTGDDGVCWHNGNCWYVEETQQISDEDAEHLERILSISTFE